jgi:hypothetical protein
VLAQLLQSTDKVAVRKAAGALMGVSIEVASKEPVMLHAGAALVELLKQGEQVGVR